MHIKHILLSHHGEYEYGSPKIPQTSEAFLVHLIDLMDSKMGSMEMIKKTDSSTGHWSGFVKHLDRIVYKSELPFYPDYVQEDEHQHEEKHAPSQGSYTSKPNKPKPAQEPKTSLGKMLSGLKMEE